MKRIYFDPEANLRNRAKKERLIENRAKMETSLWCFSQGYIPIKGEEGFTFERVGNVCYVSSNYAQEKLEPVRGYKVKNKIVPIKGDKNTYRDMWFPKEDTLEYTEDGFIR